MEDSQIVELYWHKNAEAIKESSCKYGAYCFAIANNILHKLYVIPSMSVAMIGNNRYFLTDEFHTAFDATFADLKQTSAEQYS